MSTENKPGFDGSNYDVYIGDGIYAAFVNGAVELRVGRHDSPKVIIIETREWDLLLNWRERVKRAQERS